MADSGAAPLSPSVSSVSPPDPRGARALTAADVRWTCNPDDLPFGATDDLPDPDAPIGQARAAQSLAFGLGMDGRGFNIFAAGAPGTGRTSLVTARLRDAAARRPAPDAWCYVHDFDDPRRPRAVRLPAGQAQVFAARVRELADALHVELPLAFDADEYSRRRVQRFQVGARLAGVGARGRAAAAARRAAAPLFDDLRAAYAERPAAAAFLDALEAHVVQNHAQFLAPAAAESPGARSTPNGPPPDPWLPFQVNVLASSAPDAGAPLVHETAPTLARLVGRVDARAEFGAAVSDHTMIRPGALHRANGGYLVLNAEELLRAGAAYDALAQALRDGEIRIDESHDPAGAPDAARLDPEPIPLDVKVALIGHPDTYALLYELDADFGELFKVLAEFDTDVDLTADTMQSYARFIAARCRQERLPHFDRAAAACVIEEGVRLADDRAKLSTHFGEIADLVREAAYWARQRGAEVVAAADVRAALDQRVRRSNLWETRIRDQMADGAITIQTDGAAVGQVNGLTLLGMGSRTFGQPARITARVFAGRDGVISIDREAKLSGPIHDKGALILSGFLNGMFGQGAPLSMSATIAFEQSYGGVEGDSASLAELLALLSALADFPLDQGVAVTGAVSQHGDLQAVGGVASKIEGFYDLCVRQGLTGRQGALIPASNVRHLTLRQDAARAVAEGRFHVYAAAAVADALEVLTGRPAGQPGATGRFPPDTVLGRAQTRLDQFARRWHDGPSH